MGAFDEWMRQKNERKKNHYERRAEPLKWQTQNAEKYLQLIVEGTF